MPQPSLSALLFGLAALLGAAASPAASPPRILLIYDMEGVSGIDREEMTDSNQPGYARGRERLTSDVNAAVRGLAAGGAGAIWVQDGHGSGNADEPDLLVERLDGRARFDFRDQDYDPYSTGIDGSFDAIVCVAMHARAGDRGFLAHTYGVAPSFTVNGVPLGETQIIALSASRWGIPVIMASGDDVLGEQLREPLPELEYAVVKRAVSLAAAEPLPQQEAESRIEAAARRAVQKLRDGRFRPYYLQPPYAFELGFQNAAQAERALAGRSVERAGERSVRYTAPDFAEGYERSKPLIALAAGERFSLLARLLRRSEDGRRLLEEFRSVYLQRWLDPAGLPDWARDAAPAPARTRFHGDN